MKPDSEPLITTARELQAHEAGCLELSADLQNNCFSIAETVHYRAVSHTSTITEQEHKSRVVLECSSLFLLCLQTSIVLLSPFFFFFVLIPITQTACGCNFFSLLFNKIQTSVSRVNKICQCQVLHKEFLY